MHLLSFILLSSISFVSFHFSAYYGYGGICIDMLGVESVCGQWAEWLTSVPLIVYMTIAVEDKQTLNSHDFVIISSCVMCIAFGFVMNFPWLNSSSGGILLFLSFASIGVTVICLSRQAARKPASSSRLDNSNCYEEENRNLAQRLKMRSIARLLLWVFPFFGIVHLMGWGKLLDRDGVFIGQCKAQDPFVDMSNICFF